MSLGDLSIFRSFRIGTKAINSGEEDKAREPVGKGEVGKTPVAVFLFDVTTHYFLKSQQEY